ncbi:class I SAM-dependent methyltransferase [Flavobacterium filum]|uniref:class I SAM-dependent methyltransferase n=1 Tax=Flavobacterium filum TaxID=370974 RepID=UPI0023F43A1B|nr:class I SAM-dependent methyltransferase [Flavobacterium filum]
MQEQKNIIECYNKTAENYAEKFLNELDQKHFDRMLLTAFCEQNKNKGQLIDFGCGPGQTTNFIYNCGLENILGTDLSDEMVKVAKRHNPTINFEQADLLNLKYKDNAFGAAIAFYAIVHFDYDQIKTALTEVKRILVDKGEFVFSFHIGKEIVYLDNFLDKEVNIKFQFFEVERIKALIEEVGFEIVDILKRQPYETEYQTERAYIWTRNNCH